MADVFDEVAPGRDIFDDIAAPASKPFPMLPFTGSGEIGDLVASGQYQPPRLPRVGFTPRAGDESTLIGPGPFSGMLEAATGRKGEPITQGTVRKAGAIIANSVLSATEGALDPKTQAIVLAATVRPEVVIPFLTATMAKSGSTKLAEGIVDLQQGRDSEGVVKVGEAGTELGFAAAPALGAKGFAGEPQAGSLAERAGTVLGRAAGEGLAPMWAEPTTPNAPPTVLRPFMPARVQAGERAGFPPIAPRTRPVVPETVGAPRETVIETIRNADARTLTQIQALFPEAKLSREQARAFRNIAFPPVPEPVRPQAIAAEVLGRSPGELPPEEPPAPSGAPVPKPPEPPAAPPAEAPKPAPLTPDALAIQKIRREFGVTEAEAADVIRQDETNPDFDSRAWLESALSKRGIHRRGFGGFPEESGMHEAAYGEAVNAADEALSAILVERSKAMRSAPLTPAEQAAAPAARAEEAPAAPPVEPPKPAAAPAPAPEPASSAATEARVATQATITALQDQLKDIARRRKEVRAEFKGVRPVSLMNRTTPRIERGQAFQRALDNLAWEERGIPEQIAKLKKELEEPPAPPPAPGAEPTAAAPVPKPAKILLGLPESYFDVKNLRKLRKDTLRRIANSLGVEPGVAAIAKKAAERFAEMPEGGPPVSMGAATPGEFAEGKPTAGTPAHTVETGPVQDRPLGPTSTPSPTFVNLAVEMLTGEPTGGVPPAYSIATLMRGLAGQSAPKLTALNRTAGEALVRYASSKIAAPYKALVFSSKALETGVDPIKFGAALVEDNLRSIEQGFLAKSHAADAAGRTDEAAAFMEQAGNVKSIIGGKNSPFQTEDAYQDFLAEPTTQEAVKRHVQAWDEEIDPMYKAAQSIDPDVELPTRGEQTGARINLKAVFEGDTPARPITASRGGLTASFKKKSPFGIPARGTGDVYESSYPDIIANTFYRQLEIANQNTMNAVLVDAGLAKIAKPGSRVDINGQPATAFPLSRRLILTKGETIPAGQNIYVDRAFADEYRRALNVDAPQQIPFVTPIAQALNKAAIAGLTDASIHVSNLFTALFTRPNSPLLWDTLAKTTGRVDAPVTVVRALIKAARDNKEQMAELAEIGALREDFKGMGPLSRIIKWADKNTRLMLDDTYTQLAKDGLVDGSETARREFVNQVGQYNKRLQGQFTVWLRDTGFGPFVTAGKTFNAMGIRNLVLSPGVKAASPMAAAALKANQLAGWVGFAALVGTLNYLLTKDKGGYVMGRPGVPLGNIDTGRDNDKGQPLSIPLGDILGYKRALRISGLRRVVENQRYGLNTNESIDNALGDVLNAAAGPIMGPVARFASVSATGYPPAIDVARVAPAAGPQQSQFTINVQSALKEANPLVASYYDVQEGKPLAQALQRQLPRFSPQASQPVVKVESLARRIEGARMNEYIDDLARRARRLPINERAAFVLAEMAKANLNQQEKQAVVQKIRPRLKYP
jgi:hypothetical protein